MTTTHADEAVAYENYQVVKSVIRILACKIVEYEDCKTYAGNSRKEVIKRKIWS